MPLDCEHAGRVVQLLADVFADAHAFAPALAHGTIGFVMDIRAGQLQWKLRALRLLSLLVARRIRMKLIQLDFDSSDIGADRLIGQAGLLDIELFAALAELQTLEHRDLVCKLIDARLTVMQLPFALTDLLDQLSRQGTKLLGAEVVEISGRVHANQFARTDADTKSKLFTFARYLLPYTTQIA